MTEFRKNQQVKAGPRLARIESGPWMAGSNNRPSERYLIEIIDPDDADYRGTYRLYEAVDIKPIPPKAGDQGYLESLNGDTYTYTIEYMSDEVVLLWRRPSVIHGKAWRSVTRAHFDQDWRPES